MTNTPRCSSTSSWTIFGIWNSIQLVRTAISSFLGVLLGIELDDELLLHRRVDLGPLRPLEDLPGEAVVVGLEPRRDGRREVGGVADHRLGGAAWSDGDDVVRLDLVARDVHAAAVHVEVPVPHELARLRARDREAEPVDDVVEPGLEHPQQGLAGDARALRRLRVVGAELVLEQAVVAARLLLLAQLEQVLGLLDAAAAVLARRIAASLDGALLREAALALQEELHALPAADAALGTEVSRHARPSASCVAARRCGPAASRPSRRGSRVPPPGASGSPSRARSPGL